ncbi:hypothetical protein LOK46_06065 [Methylobacterium sp. NMS14P]|uniref:hypothetical protein n=1 Tax=Methylobacterium sp. NMS14P TaxID=2894310 RepID=UPI002359BDC8|nr:hypothetical protein [Methylobacterium sp. NMS14P]WCS26398.1 hypothetical protein LOK46_06065 [Methylobacterium sp. NMS14P]
MRDDLRRAIKHLARAKGMSLSKQVEAYVEKRDLEDIVALTQDGSTALDPVLISLLDDVDGAAARPWSAPTARSRGARA